MDCERGLCTEAQGLDLKWTRLSDSDTAKKAEDGTWASGSTRTLPPDLCPCVPGAAHTLLGSLDQSVWRVELEMAGGIPAALERRLGGQTQWDTGIWWAEVKVWKGEGGHSFQLRRRPGQASAAESMKSGQEIGCQWERGLWSLSTDTRTSAVLSHVPLQTPMGAPTESLQNVQGRVGWGRHGHPGGGSVAARSAWQKESLPKRPHRLTCKFHRSYAEPAVLRVWP